MDLASVHSLPCCIKEAAQIMVRIGGTTEGSSMQLSKNPKKDEVHPD